VVVTQTEQEEWQATRRTLAFLERGLAGKRAKPSWILAKKVKAGRPMAQLGGSK